MKMTYRKVNKPSTKAKIGQCNYIDQDNSKELKKKNVATVYNKSPRYEKHRNTFSLITKIRK